MMGPAEKIEIRNSRLIEECLRSSLGSFRQMFGEGVMDVEAHEFIQSSIMAQACLKQLHLNGVAVVLTLSGCLSGTFRLVLNEAAARQLVAALVGEVPRKGSFSDMARSALKEVANVIASAFLVALERWCGSGGMPGLPELYLDSRTSEDSNENTGSTIYGLSLNLGGRPGDRGNAGIFIALNSGFAR
ncbi:MAG: hypothetical protein R6V33_02795 [Pelovirga sp.]